MSDIDITIQGIVKILNGLTTYKASGPDLISARFLKETDVIVKIIFKVSLNTNEVPSDWRIANITPILAIIFKKRDYWYNYLPQNYQPISLTSACCQ